MGIGRKLLSSLVSLTFIITPVLSFNMNVAASEVDAVNETITVSEFPEILHAGSTSSVEAYWRQFSTDYYYDQFTTSEKILYDRMDDKCMDILLGDEYVNYDFTLDASDLDLYDEDALKVMILFKFSNPQYFFLTSEFTRSYYSDSYYTDSVSLRVYSQFCSGSGRASARNNLKSVFDYYIDYLEDYPYPEQKEAVLMALMSDNITYTTDVDFEQSVYSAANGATVCTGYALLFSAIMNAYGIECATVCSADHAWNIIKIHGFWYYVDVTWIDQDAGDWLYLKYYNHETTSEAPFDYIKDYLPEFYYDMLDSDYDYDNRYVRDGDVIYCIVSDTSSTGRKVVVVSGSTSAQTVTIGGYTYTVISAPGTGWRQEGSVWRYYDSSGYMVKGWYEIEGDWYYFSSSGEMLKGWVSVNSSWFYLGGNGVMRTGWQSVDGSWYYFSDSGNMTKGWKSVGGSWYYFGSNGVMRTYWQTIDGSWYYFGSNGTMRTNWQKISNNWYFFGGNGIMRTGWQAYNGRWYYLDGSGVMKTGWTQVDGAWYYFDSEGAMKTGWYCSGGSWYYLDTNGKMVTGKKTINGKEYSFNGDGVCQNP